MCRKCQKVDNCFFFSKIWYTHTFGHICLLYRTVSQQSDVAHGPLVFWISSEIYAICWFFLLQILSSTPFLQSINYARPSRGILYRLRHLSSLHTSTLSLTQQRKLQTTPLNNVKSRPPHWTMWTPDHSTEQCEFQTTPPNNLNSRPPHWTMWTPDHLT